MIHEAIEIRLDQTPLGPNEAGFQPKLYTYVLDNTPEIDPERRRPAVVLCPGGGYVMTSDREAEPVAIRLNALGYQVFVLRYSVAPAVFPRALAELAAAVAMVRSRADEWHVDPQRITVGGFSAGGHLACSLGVFWQEGFLKKIFRSEETPWRPDRLMLCYPVITSGPFAHRGSFENLLGGMDSRLMGRVSLETQVSGQTPPTFLWHTYEDETVPVENALLLAWALKRHQVPLEMHLYTHGRHGISLANEETRHIEGHGVQPECQNWVDLFDVWQRSL